MLNSKLHPSVARMCAHGRACVSARHEEGISGTRVQPKEEEEVERQRQVVTPMETSR